MTGKKRTILLILLVLLLVTAVTVFVFRDTITVYLFPKLVLSQALTESVEQLYSRFSQSPVALLGKYLDSRGLYTAQMKLTTENDLAGEIIYDLTVQGNLNTNQIHAEGVAASGGTDLDLSLYMDRDFMAVSSADLLNGAYYGIRYETFPQDIRSIPLLKLFVGEKTISQWDESVAGIAEQMAVSYKLPEFPEISQEELQEALMAVLLLPSDVKQEEMKVLGDYQKVYRIQYHVQGDQVRQVLGQLIDGGDGSDPAISVTFYLYEKEIVMLQVQGVSGGNSIRCALEFLCDSPDTITLRFSAHENGEETALYLRHSAEMNGGILKETWVTCPGFEGAGEKTTLAYRWDPTSGDLVTLGQQSVAVNLMETEKGIRIQTNQFEQLLAMLTQRDVNPDSKPSACIMTLQTGAQLHKPAYKNLDIWSLDDLVILLEGLGGFMGIKTR